MVKQVIMRNSAGHLVTLGDEEWQRVVDPATGEIRALPRSLVTGGDPDAPATVPEDAAFTFDAAGSLAYIEAPGLAEIGAGLLDRHPEFEFLRLYRLRYLWEREGDARGRVRILKRELGHLGRADLLLIVAADRCRAEELAAWQLEAQVCDLLASIGRTTTGKLVTRPPDFAGHLLTYRTYGPWQAELAAMTETARQLDLFESMP